MILLEEIHNLYLYCDMLKFNNLLGEQSYFLCVWLWPISLYFWRDLSFNVHYAVAKSFLPEQKEMLTLRSKWSWYWILNNKSNQIKKVFLFCWNIFFFLNSSSCLILNKMINCFSYGQFTMLFDVHPFLKNNFNNLTNILAI